MSLKTKKGKEAIQKNSLLDKKCGFTLGDARAQKATQYVDDSEDGGGCNLLNKNADDWKNWDPPRHWVLQGSIHYRHEDGVFTAVPTDNCPVCGGGHI